MDKRLKKFFLIIIVLIIIGLGISLIVLADLGPDSISLLCQGIHEHMPGTFGIATLAYNVAIILIALLFAKKYLGAGTVLYAVLIGAFIDLFMLICRPFDIENQSVYIRFMVFILGQCFYSLGLSLLIKLNLGMNALDALMTKLSDLTHIQYMYFRVAADFSYCVIGYLLGGTFGVGTVISVLFTGTLVTFFGKVFKWEKLIKLED
ncbi:MAG: hypothetical protein LBM02_04465 [Lachnospiraceae bacterium]|nr:hypothetical protein [Lachnospiraceae bacterium]